MTSKLRGALVILAAAVGLAGGPAPVSAAALGTAPLALTGGDGALVQNVGYWYRGRWYAGAPGPNGAAVGAGIALGILGAAAIAGAAAAPPPPVVYYDPPPPVYVAPAPRVYLEAPPPPPRNCWVETGYGRGYWSPC